MRWAAGSQERIILPEGFVQPEYNYVGSEPRSKSVRERIESQLVEQGISGARIFESVDIFHDYARFETDFVLLIPNFPIIFIEVKDVRSDVELTHTRKHVRVKYSDGMKDVTIQIKRAEDALKRWIDDIKRSYSFEAGTPTFVAFLYMPAYEFDRDTLLKANSQHRTLHKPDNNTLIREILDHAREHGSSAPSNGRVDRGKWTPVGKRDIDFLTRWLCAEPRVQTWVSRSSKRRHFSASRVTLEFDRMLGLRMNRDLFIEGAGGAGQTRLALQLWKTWGKDARRSALILPSPAAAKLSAEFRKAAPSATHVVTNWKSLVEDLWPGRSAPRSAEVAPRTVAVLPESTPAPTILTPVGRAKFSRPTAVVATRLAKRGSRASVSKRRARIQRRVGIFPPAPETPAWVAR